MDKLVEMFQSLAGAGCDLVSLVFLEDGPHEGEPKLRLDTLAKKDPVRIWRATGLATLICAVLFTLTAAFADGEKPASAPPASASIDVGDLLGSGMNLHASTLPLVLGFSAALIALIVPYTQVLSVLTARRPRRWTLLTIWAGALAPAVVGLAIGGFLISLSSRIPDETTMLIAVGLGIGVGIVALVWGFLRGAIATQAYLVGVQCIRHGDRCPALCRAWYALVSWAPVLVVAMLVLRALAA